MGGSLWVFIGTAVAEAETSALAWSRDWEGSKSPKIASVYFYCFCCSSRIFPNWLTFYKNVSWNRNIKLQQSLCQDKLEASKHEGEWLSLIKWFWIPSSMYLLYLWAKVFFPAQLQGYLFLLDIGRNWNPFECSLFSCRAHLMNSRPKFFFFFSIIKYSEKF